MLMDLNAFPPDELPTTSRLCSLQPTPSSDAPKRDYVAQSYPHWLASASNNFPANDHSANPRKRKNVDAGIEKMALIDPAQWQKTSLEYQKDLEVENEVSKPQTAEPVNSQEKEKPVIEKSGTSRNDRNMDISRLEESERKRVPFNVKNWSFVRTNSNIQSNEDNETVKNFFKAMTAWKSDVELSALKLEPHQHGNEEFWLPKQYETSFIGRFRDNVVGYPDEEILPRSARGLEILKTILKLSDEKLDLERYPVFSNHIVEYMTQKLREHLKHACNKSWGNIGNIATRIEYIKKLTKCMVFLHIVLLCLFNEHENGILTKGYIEDYLIDLGHVWRDIESGSNNMLKDDVGQRMHEFLTFKQNWPITGAGSVLGTAWKIVRHCAKEKSNFFPADHGIVAEMVNKLILYSNYGTILNKAQAKVRGREAKSNRIRNLIGSVP
ncbi:hypothetical protein PTTG_25347 [Puccinia triticina 1-1 BBBD Race 1]|uniref:Uncharacterized protein n=1 Tax=Puccinia triticina (isolate 1-1 / race 1 (BBBD)) TaxID=630390 RepID=A0A180H3V0_PUCT1|nr:hypothetical protein PTTG_25347 [Puccinia triticina 1-1 BBBD Race 1]